MRCHGPKGYKFNRHKWGTNRICTRCKKVRNPLAGDKMFRPIQNKGVTNWHGSLSGEILSSEMVKVNNE